MSTTELIDLIEKLPANKQKEVEVFILKMNNKTVEYQLATIEKESYLVSEPIGRGYGSLKGKIWMSDDFNESPEDFKDYM